MSHILVFNYYHRFNYNYYILTILKLFVMKLTAINSTKAEDCSTLDGRQVEGALQFFSFFIQF